MKIDAFISHASEDKRYFVKPFVKKLMSRGVSVWYDEYSLQLGDSLRESIDKGLNGSRFGIVVLSEHFFRKGWPQAELDGIFSLNTSSCGQFMIPLRHKLEMVEVLKCSPMLSGRQCRDSKTKNLVELIIRKIRPDLLQEVDNRANPISFRCHLIPNPYSSRAEMSQDELLEILEQQTPSIDWSKHVSEILVCYQMIGLRYSSGLNIIYEDQFYNEVLESMYQRIFGRRVDEVGRVTYLPFIFLQGKKGVQQVENFMLSSSEYRNLNARGR